MLLLVQSFYWVSAHHLPGLEVKGAKRRYLVKIRTRSNDFEIFWAIIVWNLVAQHEMWLPGIGLRYIILCK